MLIYEIVSRAEYEATIARAPRAQFLHSWEWGAFQEYLGKKIIRARVTEDDGTIIAQFCAIKEKNTFGNYWYVPRGPIIFKAEQYDEIIKSIQKYLQEKNEGFFLRYESSFAPTSPRLRGAGEASEGKPFYLDVSRESRHVRGDNEVLAIQPKYTWIIDIRKTEEEMFRAMHYKMRYNIRLAEKRGIKIVENNNTQSATDNFIKLIHQTAVRDQFGAHPDSYYRAMIDFFIEIEMVAQPPNCFIKIFEAQYKGEILASNIIMFYGDTATYLHGASSDEYKNMMAPHLLQWQCIRVAKARGYSSYDMWGIAPEQFDPYVSERWQGITRFKKSFPGEFVAYAGTYEVPLKDVKYRVYRIVKRVYETVK